MALGKGAVSHGGRWGPGCAAAVGCAGERGAWDQGLQLRREAERAAEGGARGLSAGLPGVQTLSEFTGQGRVRACTHTHPGHALTHRYTHMHT